MPRVNAQLFNQTPDGTRVHVVGKFSPPVGPPSHTIEFISTDNGNVLVSLAPGVSAPPILYEVWWEVVGDKKGEVLELSHFYSMGNNIHRELWDNATRLINDPKCAEFF